MHKFSRKTCAFYQKGPSAAAEDSFLFSYAAGTVSDVCGVSGIAGVCVGSTSGTPGSVIVAPGSVVGTPGSLPGTVGSIAGTFGSTVGSAALPTRMMRLRLL